MAHIYNGILHVCVCVLSHVRLFVTPWTAAHQASLSSLRLVSVESVMPSSHLILCHPLVLPLKSFPASGSFPRSLLFTSGGQSFSISPASEHSGLISFRMDWFESSLGGLNLAALPGYEPPETAPGLRGPPPHTTCSWGPLREGPATCSCFALGTGAQPWPSPPKGPTSLGSGRNRQARATLCADPRESCQRALCVSCGPPHNPQFCPGASRPGRAPMVSACGRPGRLQPSWPDRNWQSALLIY